MIISIILEELYDKVSLFFRRNTFIIYQTIFLSENAIRFINTVKKIVHHYNQMVFHLFNIIVFSKTVSNRVAGTEITHFYSALVETVKIPRVKNPIMHNADTPDGIDSVPNVFHTIWQRKDAVITLLQNSPILFFSSGGNKN